MATVKHTSSDYTINVGENVGLDSWSGTFTVNAANIQLKGNVQQSNVLTSTSAFFLTAANNQIFGNTGYLTQTGGGEDPLTQTFAGIRFNSQDQVWQISPSVKSDGTPLEGYQSIATGENTVSGERGWIQYNSGSNSFSSSTNLVFDSGNSVLTIGGAQLLKNVGDATPTIPSGAQARYLYSNPPGSGGTGLYFLYSPSTGAGVTDELISKTKAIVYSLIF